MNAATAYISLGSNLGDRALTLKRAIAALGAQQGVEVRAVSETIETDPVAGPPDQGKYLNAVVKVQTTLSPELLLKALGRIETELGRDRRNEQRWGPRTCDLDILLMDDIVMETPELTIPHPRMHERLFVLKPLAGIAPDVVHPALGKTIAELLAEAEAARNTDPND